MARRMTIAYVTLAAALVAGSVVVAQVRSPDDMSGEGDPSSHQHQMADGKNTGRSGGTEVGGTRTRISMVSSSTLPRLRGYVGADSSLTISQHKVPRGWYRIVVIDDAIAHNWHIRGRRVDKGTDRYVDKETTVRGTGKWVWTVRLRKGTYKIVCDPHQSWMYTYLRVTGG